MTRWCGCGTGWCRRLFFRGRARHAFATHLGEHRGRCAAGLPSQELSTTAISSILMEIPFLRRKPELLIDPRFLCYNNSPISPLRGGTQVSSLGIPNLPLSQTSGCIVVWGVSRESCIHVAECSLCARFQRHRGEQNFWGLGPEKW